MKIVFETEYEKLCFERLLETIYEDSAPSAKDTADRLADLLASLFVKVSKSDTEVQKTDYTESITMTKALALPELPYFGEKPDV
jgi:hypothetical protein